MRCLFRFRFSTYTNESIIVRIDEFEDVEVKGKHGLTDHQHFCDFGLGSDVTQTERGLRTHGKVERIEPVQLRVELRATKVIDDRHD